MSFCHSMSFCKESDLVRHILRTQLAAVGQLVDSGSSACQRQTAPVTPALQVACTSVSVSQPAYCMLQHLGCLHVQQCGIFAACRASCPSHLHCTVAVHAARSCSGDYTIKRRADIPNNEVDCNAKNYKVRWCPASMHTVQ